MDLNTILPIIMIILMVFIFLCVIRAILGPRFTDRLVALNCVSTLIIVIIILLSIYLAVDYLIDVALVYAMLGFVANVVFTRMLINKHRRKANVKEEN